MNLKTLMSSISKFTIFTEEEVIKALKELKSRVAISSGEDVIDDAIFKLSNGRPKTELEELKDLMKTEIREDSPAMEEENKGFYGEYIFPKLKPNKNSRVYS